MIDDGSSHTSTIIQLLDHVNEVTVQHWSSCILIVELGMEVRTAQMGVVLRTRTDCRRRYLLLVGAKLNLKAYI